jgi:hypothetical protein
MILSPEQGGSISAALGAFPPRRNHRQQVDDFQNKSKLSLLFKGASAAAARGNAVIHVVGGGMGGRCNEHSKPEACRFPTR